MWGDSCGEGSYSSNSKYSLIVLFFSENVSKWNLLKEVLIFNILTYKLWENVSFIKHILVLGGYYFNIVSSHWLYLGISSIIILAKNYNAHFDIKKKKWIVCKNKPLNTLYWRPSCWFINQCFPALAQRRERHGVWVSAKYSLRAVKYKH